MNIEGDYLKSTLVDYLFYLNSLWIDKIVFILPLILRFCIFCIP